MKKQISRREFLGLVGVAGGAALLAACQPTATAEPTTAAEEPTTVPAAEKIVLEMLSYAIVEGDPHDQAFKLFQAAHPDWEITWSPIAGSWAEMATKIITRVAAGNSPDMCAITTYGASITMGRDGILLDQTEFLTSDADFAGNPIPQNLLNMYTTNGIVWGIPKDYVTQGFYYNKKMLEDAGVELPTADWTWDDMLVKAKALTSGEGVDKIFGLYTETGYYQNEQFFWGNKGPGFFDRWNWDFTTPTANDPKNIEALQKLVDTILVDEISPTAEALNTQSGGDRQLSGKLAMWMGSTITSVALLQNTDKVDWAVVPNPRMFAGGPSYSMLWTSGYSTLTATKHPSECWEFLKHFSIGEGAKILGTTGFSVPSGAPDAFLTEEMVARGGQIFIDAANADIAACDSLGELHAELGGSIIGPNIEAAFLGQSTPEEALNTIQEGMTQILADNQ